MKHLTIIWSLLLCILFGTQVASAQSYTMKGTVTDANGPVIGAAVTVKDNPTVGTNTDVDGKFTLKVDRGATLLFSYLGYKDVEYLVVKQEQDLKIVFSEAATEVEEVVVTALGTTQRKISSLAAVTAVDVKDLQQPTASVANLLGGRVAGVISSLASGEPGKNIAEFWIRGIGTFGANASALVLIDGLEGDINSIDPSDIESFSVLKDASATAVYGVRGANGVVLITTKRGKADKINIMARASVTVSHLKRLPNWVDAYDYASLANEAREVRGEEVLYNDVEMNIIKNGLDNDMYPNVNWQDEVVKMNSWKQAYFVSASGGAKLARYYLSLSANLEDAAYNVDKNSPYAANVGYDTYGFRANIDLELTPSTTIYFGSTHYLKSTKSPGVASTNYIWDAQATLHPLRIPTIYSNGQLPGIDSGSQTSPYVMINRMGSRLSQTYQGKMTLAVDQDLSMITEGLKIRAQGAYDIEAYFDENRTIQPELYEAVGRTQEGELTTVKTVNEQAASYSKGTNQWRKFHFESTLNYDRTFAEDHRTSALLYYYMSDEKASSESTSNMNAIPKRYQGLSARLTYGFRDTYMLDLNFGYTGSENFQPGRRFGFFPSVALGWVPTQYEFMKDVKWLNFLKIRASYGTVGNDRIANKRFPYLTIVNRGSNSPFGSASQETLMESYIGADNLEWEVATKADLGIEGKLFDSRVDFVVDFFNDQRSGIYQQRVQVPSYVGLTSMPFSNVGEMRSYGADGNISYTERLTKDLSLTLRANFTYSKNDIDNWEEANPKYPYLEHAGYPNGVVRGYHALGLFKDDYDIETSPVQTFGNYQPGDIKYADINGDGRIDSDDKTPIAYSATPILMYGFGGEIAWRNLSLGVLFKGTGNTDFFYGGNGYIPFANGKAGNVISLAADPANRWIPMEYALENGIDPSLAENPNAIYPRLNYGAQNNNNQTSTFWKGNSRYLRLQEITLNYNFKAKALQKVGIKSVDLQFVGNNLAVWDQVDIFDPEQASSNGRVYPLPATFTLQMYLHF